MVHLYAPMQMAYYNTKSHWDPFHCHWKGLYLIDSAIHCGYIPHILSCPGPWGVPDDITEESRYLALPGTFSTQGLSHRLVGQACGV